MLLKLREQALAEKTRAHLAWLEQQKLQRKKGSDDSYPVIRQKQKEILEKHKREKVLLLCYDKQRNRFMFLFYQDFWHLYVI